MRLEPHEAALALLASRFPDCTAAILAGSVVRGEGTPTSDLDIVIFDETLAASYRESLFAYGWPIEVFVHSLTSYARFFQKDCQEGTPCMPQMVSEGIILKGREVLAPIISEARELLARGPEPLTPQAILSQRYSITDLLDDFLGATDRLEGLFTAQSLTQALNHFVLRAHGRWIGNSKWLARTLKTYDPALAQRFLQAMEAFYQWGEKGPLKQLALEILAPYGGRLFDGFSLGK